MTCSQEEGVFSWQGQSALGSCITERAQTWLENIITHAAGTFSLMLGASVAVATAADLVGGQMAMLHGKEGGAPPVWTYQGDGPAFVVGPQADLEIRRIVVAATSGLAFRVAGSALLRLADLQLQRGDGSAADVSCAGLATGVGQSGLTCAETGAAGVTVRGPLFISTSGTGFGMGATKYMGEDRDIFEEVVSTKEAGLYTLQITHDELVSLLLPVESAMHVSIVGDDAMPQWIFNGEGPAFTVAVKAYLTLAYLTLPASKGDAGSILLSRGGELSVDHSHLQGTHLVVDGSWAVSSSQLDDIALESSPHAIITMEAVMIVGTGPAPLALGLGCSTSITGGEIRNTQLQVASTGQLTLTGATVRVDGMVLAVASGGSFTVSTSQLIHGKTTDAFPCNGGDMRCSEPHAGSVLVTGPASINTAAPLVCADESAGSCLSGYIDMPSCLADIATGMQSCFVYLQHDTGRLGAIVATAGQYFEVHGQQGARLQLQADWDVAAAASVTLADLRLLGSAGAGSQMSVVASGQLALHRVEMQDGQISFSGAISVVGCVLGSSQLLGTTESSSLALSGGTITGSTVNLSSGTATVDGGCVLANSPVRISGEEGKSGTLTISEAELQSDGTGVPLTVESDGAATVATVVFRSTAGDITVVSVAEDGSLTVGASQLVHADGGADPFPCDGTLPTCVGAHAGVVVVDGPSAVNMAAPLVCDVQTGACSSVTCPEHPFPPGMVMYSSSPVHILGSKAEYGCGVAGIHLPRMYLAGTEVAAGTLQPRDGDASRVCQANGTWSGTAPTACPPCCSATICCDCYQNNQACYRPDWPTSNIKPGDPIHGVPYPYGNDAWSGECMTDDDYCGCQCGRWAPRSCGMGPDGKCGADDDCDRAC
jgi:hypothetical protein